MALDFPSNPSNNQIYTDSTTGNRYRYDSPSASWEFSPLSILNGISNSHVLFTSNEGTFAGNTGLTFNANANTLTANTINAYSMRVTGNLYVGSNTVTITNDAVMAQSFFIMDNGAPVAVSTGATTNASYEVANAAFAHSNTTLIHSQDVYNAVNSAFGVINATFTQSNTDNVRLTSAYDSSNAGYTVANAAFNAANAEFTFSNTIYAAVNSAFGVINAAFASANNVAPQIAPAFNTANAAFDMANTKLASAGGTITGDLVVQGNATISGVTTYANTQTLLIGDNLVTLNADIPNNVAPSENSGLEINRGSSSNVSILWNEGNDRWTFTNDGSTYNQIASNVDVSTVDSRLTSAFDVANAAYTSSNADYVMSNAAFTVANAAFGVANTVTNYLPLSGGTLSNTVFIRGYTGGTAGSLMANYTKSFVIGGPYNQTYNSANAVLMLIADYSNDAGDNVYPIYVEDENNIVDFYLYAGADQTIASKRAYIAGSLGVGTTTPGYKLDVSGIINTSDQFRASGGGGDVRLNGNYGGTTAVVGTVGSTGFGIMTSNDPSRLWITSGGNVGVGTNTPGQKLHVVGTGFASSDFRSPIFYDSDNTGFYVDPASTSVFNALTVGGNGVITYGDENVTRYRGSITSQDWNTYVDGTESGYYLVENMSGSNRPSAYTYGTQLNWSISGAAKFQIYAPHNGTDGNGIFIRTGWNTDYDAWNELAITSKSFTNNVDLRAPIFYDSNDTTYYIDPNSTGDSALRVRGGALFGPNTSWGRFLWVGGNGRPSDEASVAATDGNLHIDSRSANSLYLNHYVGSVIYACNGGGYMQVANSTRSPIFYDSNDTAFYVDPNSVSRMSITNIDYLRGSRTINSSYNSSNTLLETPTGIEIDSGRFIRFTGGLAPFSLYRTSGDQPAPYGIGWGNGGESSGIFQRLASNGGSFGEMIFYTGNDGSGSFAFRRGTWEGTSFQPSGSNHYGTLLASIDWSGNFVAVGNITAYFSDKRLKTDIKPIENAIEKVKQITGITYRNNELAKSYGYSNQDEQVGVLAQDVEKVLPQVVTQAPFDMIDTEGSGKSRTGEFYKTIMYDKLVPLLIEAIKEQQAQIDELKRQIKSN